MTGERCCTACGASKPATADYFHRRGEGLRRMCKDCRNAAASVRRWIGEAKTACWKYAGQKMLAEGHDQPRWRLCHGFVDIGIRGTEYYGRHGLTRMPHAWVDDGAGWVWDPQNYYWSAKDEWELLRCPEVVAQFTLKQLAAKVLEDEQWEAWAEPLQEWDRMYGDRFKT